MDGLTYLVFAVILLIAVASIFLIDLFSKKRELEEYLWRANLARKQNNYPAAVSAYQQALEIDPDHLESLQHLGWIYARLQQFSEAAEIYEKVAELDDTDFRIHNRLGQLYERLDQEENAIESYKKVIEKEPDYATAHANLGKLHHQKKRYDEAIECYKNALKISNTFMAVRNKLGQAYVQSDKFDDAVRLYEESIRLNPTDTRNYLHLAQAFSRSGRFERSISVYHQALKIEPNSPLLHTQLGRTLYMVKDRINAEAEYRLALSFNEDYPLAQYNLAVLLAEQNKTEEAMSFLQQALFNDRRLASLAMTDTAFDKIRALPEFTRMMQKQK